MDYWHFVGALLLKLPVPVSIKTLFGASPFDKFQFFPPAPQKNITRIERKPMSDRPDTINCDDDTQSFTIQLPCRLAERAEKYANETGNSITGVVIEALDTFLRGRKVD